MIPAEDTSKWLIVFVTGVSGSGLKTGISALEDIGIYCIDNLPVEMIRPTISLLEQEKTFEGDKVAFGIHVRTIEELNAFLDLLSVLNPLFRTDTIFLTAEDEVLELRYSANRRKHYLLTEGRRLQEAFSMEKKLKKPLSEAADIVVDTSHLAPQQLVRMIETRYHSDFIQRKLYVMISSFGFKYGQYRPADSLFDVRFLNNPYFVPALREKNGLDAEVRDFILADSDATALLNRLCDWHTWLFPQYFEEGKHYFRIGIGCTGGRHRSVCVVEQLYQLLKIKVDEYIVLSRSHRDINIGIDSST